MSHVTVIQLSSVMNGYIFGVGISYQLYISLDKGQCIKVQAPGGYLCMSYQLETPKSRFIIARIGLIIIILVSLVHLNLGSVTHTRCKL